MARLEAPRTEAIAVGRRRPRVSGPRRAAWAGTQTPNLDAGQRDWTHVAMNADGPRQFAVRLNVAATATSLPWIAAGLLTAVLVTLGGAAADSSGCPKQGG